MSRLNWIRQAMRSTYEDQMPRGPPGSEERDAVPSAQRAQGADCRAQGTHSTL